jgi:hypothetical protein
LPAHDWHAHVIGWIARSSGMTAHDGHDGILATRPKKKPLESGFFAGLN